jgi:hypothetical protein
MDRVMKMSQKGRGQCRRKIETIGRKIIGWIE